jgi:hypothetical protein
VTSPTVQSVGLEPATMVTQAVPMKFSAGPRFVSAGAGAELGESLIGKG